MVVLYLKIFPSIFYFQFLEQGKIPFGSVKFGANLNPFEIKLIRFENRIGRHCAAGPACHCRAASRSPRTPSLPTGPRARPVPPVSHSRSRCARLPPPLFTRVRRAHVTCAARHYPSSPEPPRPCRADSRGAAPRALPLRSSLRVWAASAIGPGRQAVAQPAFRPTAHGRPPGRAL
jgi:hypothetical protein